MKRLVTLLLALVGLTVVLGSCGGGGEEEEAAILAVAFRLDEGSPVLIAYAGDPDEEPFEPPAGRYYIEAVDQDDVVISLGEVVVEDGGAVELPSSLDAAGGVADPEQAEPLITIASFLVDLELAEYELLEIATGGFAESPFAAAVEIDTAEVMGLVGMHADIGLQEEAVLEAISKVEGRAEVSRGSRYVSSAAAAAPGGFDEIKRKMDDAFKPEHWKRILRNIAEKIVETGQGGEIAGQIFRRMPQHLKVANGLQSDNFGQWVTNLKSGTAYDSKIAEIVRYWAGEADRLINLGLGRAFLVGVVQAHDAVANPARVLKVSRMRTFLGQDSSALPLKQAEWRGFAKTLAENLPAAEARHLLIAKIAGDFIGRFPDADPETAKGFVTFFLDEITRLVPALAAEPPPPVDGQPAAVSAIDSYVQGIAAGWSGLGFDVEQGYMDELTRCLAEQMEAGSSFMEAIAQCPLPEFQPPSEGEPEEPPSPEPEEPPSPEPEEPPSPEPEETSSPEPEEPPSPEPAETPTPGGDQVRAEGPWLVSYELGDECEVKMNTMWLTFPSGGGDVRGEGHWVLSCETSCGTATTYQDTEYKGNYSPDSNTLSGSWIMDITGNYYSGEGETCEPQTSTSQSTAAWQATFEGGGLAGDFQHLTVQGQ